MRLLILGLVLWIGAPLLYLTKFRLLTRPVTESQDLAAIAKTQTLVLAASATGMLLLFVSTCSRQRLAGMTIVGYR